MATARIAAAAAYIAASYSSGGASVHSNLIHGSYVPQSCPCRLACGSAAFAGLAVVNRNQHTDRPRHITTPVEIARIYHCVVSAMRAKWGARGSERSAVLDSVASLPALGPWAPPAERGPSLESIYRVSLTVDLCQGNKIISFKQFILPLPVGGPSKRKKNPGALGTCPVCPLVKTALPRLPCFGQRSLYAQDIVTVMRLRRGHIRGAIKEFSNLAIKS